MTGKPQWPFLSLLKPFPSAVLGLWVQAQSCKTFLKRTRHQVLFHVKEFYTCIQGIFIISDFPIRSSTSPGSPQHILLSTSCLLFLNNPLSPDSDAYMYMSLGPPTGAWTAYQCRAWLLCVSSGDLNSGPLACRAGTLTGWTTSNAMCCWVWFAEFCWGFCSIWRHVLGLSFSFFTLSSSVFGFEIVLALLHECVRKGYLSV